MKYFLALLCLIMTACTFVIGRDNIVSTEKPGFNSAQQSSKRVDALSNIGDLQSNIKKLEGDVTKIENQAKEINTEVTEIVVVPPADN